MIDGARKLPVQHITIRVPWHDNGWNGTFCKKPCQNTSCTILPRILSGRNDELESLHAGKSFEDFEQDQFPPCVDEHATILANFSISKTKSHPYSNKDTHQHFDPTVYTIQPFSAAAVPFRWMLKSQAIGDDRKKIIGRAEELKLDFESQREPNLGFETDWVQEGKNQRVLLDTFFSAINPNDSLVFFYSKLVPFVEDNRRVIIGVGRVKNVGLPTEYSYKGGSRPKDKISGYLWERNIEHSVRPNKFDGFMLPYNELITIAENDQSVDLLECTAFAPQEYNESYSYGSEHLPQDGAIASLLALEKSMVHMRELFDAPWNDFLKWIDTELNRIWQARGGFPGLGAALHAFGFPHGNLLAWHLLGNSQTPIDPWPKLTEVLNNPNELPDFLRSVIGKTYLQKWQSLNGERRQLLILLSRLNLKNEQARRWYDKTERETSDIIIEDKEILENPYLIYELDRSQIDAISFSIVDRGLFPTEQIRATFPISKPTAINEAIDKRRVRALIIQTLEDASSEGHTILPEVWLIKRIRERPMKPECPIDSDILPIFEEHLSHNVSKVETSTGKYAFQLDRYCETSKLISQKIRARAEAKSHVGTYAWETIVNQAIDNKTDTSSTLAEDDKKARMEKIAALEMLFKSRVSVLMGSAGTGKSTLMKALCSIAEIRDGGILLLAPTGKARVRLEETSGLIGQGRTVAQFLNKLKRYDPNSGRYFINTEATRSSSNKTVIIDECSMLTEDQLAALLDALVGVERLILVGDDKQLPPIGAGKPFVDIVNFLKPLDIDSKFPKVSKSYIELTVTMRQVESNQSARDDVLFANMFAGKNMDSGSDEIWHSLPKNQSSNIKIVKWDNSEQLHDKIINELVFELGLLSNADEIGFEKSIGGFVSEKKDKVYVYFNAKYGDRSGASEKAENWQILSPVRQTQNGVLALNKLIQKQFRKNSITDSVKSSPKKIFLSPVGSEGIIYGDKVINVINNGKRKSHPEKEVRYVANGDIGIVIGQTNFKGNTKPYQLQVEFASQMGFAYKFYPSEFTSQESSPPLELAYALTVHKSQGSEFNTTFIVIPRHCRVLSKEMLYTALTRQKSKIIILHEGDFKDLQKYTSDEYSDISKRLTNLFRTSEPVEIKTSTKTFFLDKNLIYMTTRGELVRSKSEWIIADKLHSAGIDYIYEQPTMLDKIERFPVFTIVDDDRGTKWYWEHNGMLDNEFYKERWERKLMAYRNSGILPLSEGGGVNGTLLITEEFVGNPLSEHSISENIKAILGN